MSIDMNRLEESAPNILRAIENLPTRDRSHVRYSQSVSGVTEVRLYRNTVDKVPADFTDVTAEVLSSAATDHGAGVKRCLDGAATMSGLAGGTRYCWVELVDASGNTVGPHPGGNYMMPTVKGFLVSVVSSSWEPRVFAIESSFGVTPRKKCRLPAKSKYFKNA
jgi:hypothetical protein